MSSRGMVNSSAFLSGCFPIALIEVVRLLFSASNNIILCGLSLVFLVTTIAATIYVWRSFSRMFSKADIPCRISNLKRKDMFSSGALSFYILPFVSFIGDNIQSIFTLFVVTIVLLVIFNNNMMFMYTPLLDFLGYKVLEGDISSLGGDDTQTAVIVVRSGKGLFFSGSNRGLVNCVSENVYFFVKNEG